MADSPRRRASREAAASARRGRGRGASVKLPPKPSQGLPTSLGEYPSVL